MQRRFPRLRLLPQRHAERDVPLLYITNLRENILYRNDGAAGFAEVGGEAGAAVTWSTGAAFGDCDADGDVDLYASIFGTYDVFYAEVGAASFGVSEIGAQGNAVGVAAGDYDNDGDLDVYVINQSRRSALSRNDLGAATFVDIGEESGTDNLALGAGCAFGDYDSDGDLDLFVVNGGGPDRVFMNRGDGTFVNMATAYGMADTSCRYPSRSTRPLLAEISSSTSRTSSRGALGPTALPPPATTSDIDKTQLLPRST